MELNKDSVGGTMRAQYIWNTCKEKGLNYAFLYLTAIVLANLVISIFGPGWSIATAFVFIGFDFTCRDRLHELWHNKRIAIKMGILILAGSIISWAINHNTLRIAIASMIAFGVSAILDTIVYTILYRYNYMIKINGSNIISSLSDSILFPTIAFGSIMPLVILGQLFAKIIGGYLWAHILIKHR